LGQAADRFHSPQGWTHPFHLAPNVFDSSAVEIVADVPADPAGIVFVASGESEVVADTVAVVEAFVAAVVVVAAVVIESAFASV